MNLRVAVHFVPGNLNLQSERKFESAATLTGFTAELRVFVQSLFITNVVNVR